VETAPTTRGGADHETKPTKSWNVQIGLQLCQMGWMTKSGFRWFSEGRPAGSPWIPPSDALPLRWTSRLWGEEWVGNRKRAPYVLPNKANRKLERTNGLDLVSNGLDYQVGFSKGF
jgi:hypothetical protein